MRTLLLIFAIIAVASAISDSRISLISTHLATLAKSGYSVDTVLQLLNALKNSQQGSLDEYITLWETREAALNAHIEEYQGLASQQHQWCDSIDVTIVQLKDERRKYRDFIASAEDTIKVNAETLAARLEARCTANLAFVNKLKGNQDAAALLNFLREKVSNPAFRDYLNSQHGAFAELNEHLTSKKHHALSMIAKHHMLSTLQQDYKGEDDLHYDQRARTDEEIGNKHHDNDKGALSVDSFTIDARNLDDFLAQLLGFIDGLIDQLNAENAALQAAEFSAVQDLIHYQDQIEQEAIVLNLYIGQWSTHIEELTVTIEINSQASEECHERADHLDGEVKETEKILENETEVATEKKKSLRHTIEVLEEVISVYAEKVASAAEEYKREYDQEINEARGEESPNVGGGNTGEEEQPVEEEPEEEEEEALYYEPPVEPVDQGWTVHEGEESQFDQPEIHEQHILGGDESSWGTKREPEVYEVYGDDPRSLPPVEEPVEEYHYEEVNTKEYHYEIHEIDGADPASWGPARDDMPGANGAGINPDLYNGEEEAFLVQRRFKAF